MSTPRTGALRRSAGTILFALLLAACVCTAQTQSEESAPELKPVEWHMIFAMSFRGGYSEIAPIAPVSHRYVSNIDFSIFDVTFTIETDQTTHNFMIFACPISAQELAIVQRDWPLPLLGGSAQYKPIRASGSAIGSDPEITALDLLHHYYDQNRPQLIGAAAERDRLRQIAETQRALIPPHTGPPVTLNGLSTRHLFLIRGHENSFDAARRPDGGHNNLSMPSGESTRSEWKRHERYLGDATCDRSH